MRKFSCGDVVEGCAWSADAQSDEELFKKIAGHAKGAHGISQIPDELIQKVKSKIQDA